MYYRGKQGVRNREKTSPDHRISRERGTLDNFAETVVARRRMNANLHSILRSCKPWSEWKWLPRACPDTDPVRPDRCGLKVDPATPAPHPGRSDPQFLELTRHRSCLQPHLPLAPARPMMRCRVKPLSTLSLAKRKVASATIPFVSSCLRNRVHPPPSRQATFPTAGRA
jgi:hypothetical protein